MKLNTLDLFCGAGGFSRGFSKAGYNIVAGIDNKKSAIQTFEYNHNAEGIEADLTNTDPEDIEKKLDEDINVIIGGPPCQGFSIAGNTQTGHDERNSLVNVFLDFIEHFEPLALCMENVPSIRRKEYPTDEYDNYEDLLVKRLSKIGYSVSIEVMNAARYGVPQKRRRAIVVATKQDEEPEHPEPTHVIPE